MLKFSRYIKILKKYTNSKIHYESLDPLINTILDKANSRKRIGLLDYSLKRAERSKKETGIDTGMGTPSGSSRKVYFNKGHHTINLDGIETKVRTVHKVAMFHPELDKHYSHLGATMGEFQNIVEGRKSFDKYRTLKPTNKKDKFISNPEGILPPVYGRHVLGHYLHMGAVIPLKDNTLSHNLFASATKHENFPHGLSHKQFYTAITHKQSHIADLLSKAKSLGMKREAHGLQKQHDAYSHPLVKKVQQFSKEHGIDPVDFDIHNLGIFVHPHTGKQHVVLADAGYSTNVAGYYKKVRNNQPLSGTKSNDTTANYETDKS